MGIITFKNRICIPKLMKLGLVIFLVIVIALVYSLPVQSQVNSEVQDLFGDNEEADVIVVLNDDYSILSKYGISNYKDKDNFEMKKRMIKEQQGDVFNDLKLKKKGKEISAQSTDDHDFELTNTYSTVNGFAGKLKKSSYEKLKNNPKVKKIIKSGNKNFALDASVPQVNATNAWRLLYGEINITGRGESICVIDSGIDYTHPNLGGCTNNTFLAGTCSKVIAGYDFVNNDNDPIDDQGHGTHVAGIVASTNETYRGVAPDATLVAIKVCDNTSGGNCADSDIISGIDWCVNNASKYNISVISMSLGGGLFSTYCDDQSSESAFKTSIDNAVSRNMLVVVAAGNSGSTTAIASPACIRNSTAVGSVTKVDVISSFSNRNNITDLFAPGSSIKSTVPRSGCVNCDPSGFLTLSGTSMATPHVSGAFALLRQYRKLEQNAILIPLQIQNALNSTGKRIDDTSGSGFFFSRINILSALLSLDTTSPMINFVNPTPTNSLKISKNFVFINITSNEILSNITLDWNGTNETMDGNALNWFKNKTGLGNTNSTYSYKVYANDSSGNMKLSEVRILIINNSAPVITSFAPIETSFSVSEPTNQTFNITYNDIDNDAVSITWYQNSSIASTNSNYSLGGNFTSAGIYNITVIISDGNLSNFIQWNFTINDNNQIPNVTSASLTNTDFLNRTNGTLQAFWNFSNFNNNSIISNETLWYINNTLNADYTNKTVIDAANTTKLENWAFSVRVFDGTNWSDFVNSSTIKILNAKPSINITIASITVLETQIANISLNASDLDKEPLTFTVNKSKFILSNNALLWYTNLTNNGVYSINVTVNDSLDIDSVIVNVTVIDARDLDNDGNPDFNDSDLDNDGLNDSVDLLVGNLSLVDSAIENLSVIVGDSTNLSQIFNGAFAINFTQNNITLISFDFDFSRGGDNISGTILEKSSKVFAVNGKDYSITANFIDSTRAKLIVNSESTDLLNSDDSYTLNDGAIVGVLGITFQDFAGGINSVDVYVASQIHNTLDLSKLTINKTTNGSSAVSIRGLNLSNSTKTIFLEKINTTVKSVCIKDADIGFDTITSTCDGASETLLTCDNTTSGQYTCFDTGARYKIIGLSHSALKEECRDVDGDGYGTGCSLGNDCNDNDRSKTTDCSSPSSGGDSSGGSGGGSSGGGGGGGGGAGFVCNMDWKCSDWSACVIGLQTRQCDFVKVAQHVQDVECPGSSNAPASSQKCEVPKAEAQISTSSAQANELKKEKNAGTQNVQQQQTNQITGFAAKGNFERITSTSIFAAIIVAITAGFIGFKFYRRKQQ